MRVLITGATGFLGSRAAVSLRESHTLETLPSALLRGEMTAAHAQRIYTAIAAFSPQVLLHTAAISDIGYAQQHEDESYRANVLLPFTLARLSARAGCKLVFCSSDQVYNGCGENGPFTETEPLAPLNVYGRHKLEAEKRVLDAAADAVCLRLSWMYDLPAYGLPTHPNLLTNLLLAALRGEQLSVSQADRRGVTYARQVVENLPAAFAFPGGAYNFGSESMQALSDVALTWCGTLGLSPASVRPVAGTPRCLSMDTGKARKLGVDFDDSAAGIARLASDYGLSQGAFQTRAQ